MTRKQLKDDEPTRNKVTKEKALPGLPQLTRKRQSAKKKHSSTWKEAKVFVENGRKETAIKSYEVA